MAKKNSLYFSRDPRTEGGFRVVIDFTQYSPATSRSLGTRKVNSIQEKGNQEAEVPFTSITINTINVKANLCFI